jgi:hypothetical protein
MLEPHAKQRVRADHDSADCLTGAPLRAMFGKLMSDRVEGLLSHSADLCWTKWIPA